MVGEGAAGGGAGGLTYLTNQPVTPGGTVSVYVGSGGGLNPMNNPILSWTAYHVPSPTYSPPQGNYSGTVPHSGHVYAGEDSSFGPIGPAGTIVGESHYLRDLFINIYRWSMTSANPDQLSDQAAYNVLINLYPFKDCVQKVTQEEGFVTQLGTVLVKKDEFKDVLLEPTPIVDENYIVKNQKGEVFPLVHQYDRIPQFKQFIYEKYS